MNIRRYVAGCAGMAFFCASGHSFALDPASMDLGPIEFVPTVTLGLGYDDNIYEAPSGDEKDSFVTRLAPTFLFRAEEPRTLYELRYDLLYEIFEADSDENHLDHHVLLRNQLKLGKRSELQLRGTFNRQQETRDVTNRAFDEEGNIKRDYGIGGTYRYGSDGARGQIELNAGYLWNRYENNLKGGSNNQSQEYDSPRVSGTFYWRVAPKTRALFELRYEEFDYIWSQSDLDSNNLRYLAGVTWEATAKTTGTVKVGYMEKDFSDSSLGDEDRTTWEALVTWRPSSRSAVTVKTSSEIGEGSSNENVVDRDRYALNWSHFWTPRLRSEAGFDYLTENYEGRANDGREDKISTFSLGFKYGVSRWFDIGLVGYMKENDSTVDAASYDRNTIFLTADFSL